jgi:hypothetical protein
LENDTASEYNSLQSISPLIRIENWSWCRTVVPHKDPCIMLQAIVLLLAASYSQVPNGTVLGPSAAQRQWPPGEVQPRATLGGRLGSRILSAALTPDGNTLASGHADGTIHLWEVATGQERVVLKAGRGAVGTPLFSGDGKILASRADNSTVTLWDCTF